MSAWIFLGIANAAIADLCANHGQYTASLLSVTRSALSAIGLA